MIAHTTFARPRYGETDQMGYLYYGNYPSLFELGRAELVRAMGVPYSYFETGWGVMMPVISMHIDYGNPARYDQLLTIQTELRQRPTARIRFDHLILNPQSQRNVSGYVELAFVNAQTRKPCRPPAAFMEAIDLFWGQTLEPSTGLPATLPAIPPIG